MKKYQIVIILLLSILNLSSCKKEQKPEGVLTEDKMVELILEIYEAEFRVGDLGVRRDSSQIIFDAYEDFILEKHGITSEDYFESLTYYYDHPKVLESIYDVVLDSLTLRESKLKASFESKIKRSRQTESAD